MEPLEPPLNPPLSFNNQVASTTIFLSGYHPYASAPYTIIMNHSSSLKMTIKSASSPVINE